MMIVEVVVDGEFCRSVFAELTLSTISQGLAGYEGTKNLHQVRRVITENRKCLDEISTTTISE